jgi:glycosyltransferase involved in cell wall biosynthesis
MSNPLKVLVRGPTLTSSGYGVHARQIARWIIDREKDWNLKVTFQVLPWGTTPWLVDANLEDGLIQKIIDRTTPETDKFDVSIQIQLPNEWDTRLAKYNIGITAAIETDKCNPEWVRNCNQMDAVVFPSEHARKSITNVGKINVPSFVMPEAYGNSYVKDPESLPDLQLNIDTKFNFLIVGQISGMSPDTDRKNILNTLKWTFEAFENDPDVGLIIKTNIGRHSKIDQHNTLNILSQVVKEVRKSPFPKLHFIHGMMSEDEMASLYRLPSVKALIAPTRGEGFGLPILEAAVCGIPVIATNWSGHTEFLSQGKSIQLDYDLIEVPPQKIDGRIFVQGSRWARTSEADFKKKIKKFKDNSSIPRDWARDLQKSLIESHSQKAIESKYDQVFEKVFKK